MNVCQRKKQWSENRQHRISNVCTGINGSNFQWTTVSEVHLVHSLWKLICINMASSTAIKAIGLSWKRSRRRNKFWKKSGPNKWLSVNDCPPKEDAAFATRRIVPGLFRMEHWVLRQVPNSFRLRFCENHWFHIPFLIICLRSVLVHDSEGFIFGQTRL